MFRLLKSKWFLKSTTLILSFQNFQISSKYVSVRFLKNKLINHYLLQEYTLWKNGNFGNLETLLNLTIITMSININTLPAFLKNILENYMIPLNPYTPVDSLLLATIIECSKILCFNRVKIKSLEHDLFANIYWIVFMPSWKWKDKPLGDLKKLNKYFLSEEKKYYKKHYDNQSYKIAEDAGKLKTEAQKLTYIKENSPRYIVWVSGNWTLEWLSEMREEMDKLWIWFMYYQNSEFIDFISSKNGTRFELLTMLADIYEDGTNSAKLIKSNKHAKPVDWVPQALFVHSSLSGLSDDVGTKNSLLTFMNRAFARRSIICFQPEDTEFAVNTDPNISVDEVTDLKAKRFNLIKSNEADIKDVFKMAYEATKFTYNWNYFTVNLGISAQTSLNIWMGVNTASGNSLSPARTIVIPALDVSNYTHKQISISDEASKLYNFYEHSEQVELAKREKTDNDWTWAEKTTRARKALRLAWIFAAFEHPDDLTILKEDYKQAYTLICHYGKYLESFYKQTNTLDVERLYSYILSSPEISLTEIRKAPFAPRDRYKQTSWIDWIIPELNNHCIEQGKRLLIEKWKKSNRQKLHSIVDAPETFNKSEFKDFTINLSVWDSNEKTETSYKPKSMDFNKVHEVVTWKYGYSSSLFKDNYRKKANYLWGENIIILDIDNDNKEFKLDEAKELFKDYVCMIASTRNHWKDKGDHWIKDRYRVVLFTNKIDLMKSDRYWRIMTNLVKDFWIEEYTDIWALKDTAKFYFAHAGNHWYSKGSRVLNWHTFDYEYTETKKGTGSSSKTDKGTKLQKNAIFETTDYWPLSISEAKQKLQWWVDKITCRCINPSHTDNNPSAIVGIHKESWKLMFHCFACDCKKFEK